jgi:nucleoside-diphosphate-sugar epimerase
LGAVYGSHIKGNYERLTGALARHHFIPVGNGLNRRSLIYDRDVGRAAVLAVSHSSAAGRIFNVTDGKYPTLNEIISTICQALGRTPPRFSLPVVPVRFLAGVVEDLASIFKIQSPIMRDTIDKYIEDVPVNSQRIQDELGFIPQYDLASGWKETIQEMRRAGIL